MITIRRLYLSLSYRLSRNIELRPRLLRLYKRFCFIFLKPKDLAQTPIFINNRNHHTYLKDFIDWLDFNGFSNYYVIDNDSSYPALLSYYESKLKDRVIYLKKNAGHLSIWQEGLLNKVRNSFYIYTDSDVLPTLKANPHFIKELFQHLRQYEFAIKVGSAIKIDDLPDCFLLKSKVVSHEQQFWQNELAPNVYRASIDTTLALYLPNYIWDCDHWDKHIRVAGQCLIKHQPWYENSKHPNVEQTFYRNQATSQTHWTNFGAYVFK